MTDEETEILIESCLPELRKMFPHFADIQGYHIDKEHNYLHLKGPKTIMSMPLNKVIEHFRKEK